MTKVFVAGKSLVGVGIFQKLFPSCWIPIGWLKVCPQEGLPNSPSSWAKVPQTALRLWLSCRHVIVIHVTPIKSKKSPTGSTEGTPKPEYLLAICSQLTDRGPMVRSYLIVDELNQLGNGT